MTYTVQLNSRGKPRYEVDLAPRDMHLSWVIVAPKPTPKVDVRAHADADCAYNRRGMCEVVNNRDGFYPGGRGNGTSELNLVPCTSCVEKKIHPPQVLHHRCLPVGGRVRTEIQCGLGRVVPGLPDGKDAALKAARC